MQNQTQEPSLQWFIDFINADLNQLSVGEKMKLIGDAITIIDGKTPALFEKDDAASLPHKKPSKDDKALMVADGWGNKVEVWLKKDKLTKCQEILVSCFSNMMQIYNDAKDQIKKMGIAFFRQTNSLRLLQTTSQKISTEVVLPIDEPIMMLDEASPEELKRRKGKTSSGDAEIQFLLEEFEKAKPIAYPKTETDETTLRDYFIEKLVRHPPSYFKKCIECGNWYIHKSKRRRLFCTPQCAMRKANRDRRKFIKNNDPDKYEKEKAAGRKRQKKSYRKRTKK